MAKKKVASPELQEFAREAELQYRRLAELADSAGVGGAAVALRDKASRMRILLDRSDSAAADVPDMTSAAPEVQLVLTHLAGELRQALESWPPADLAGVIDQVLVAGDQLGQMVAAKSGKPVRPRRRWTARETPPTVDPPTFPGPRRSRNKK